MQRRNLFYRILLLILGWIGAVILYQTAQLKAQNDSAAGQLLPPTPVFRFPVVADAQISGYFDHDPASRQVHFYDDRASTPDNGYTFACPAVGGAWVGCTERASDEATCSNEQELWYDDHHGIDFEFSPEWHTGASCDLESFEPLTPLIYAPAAGLIDFVGENDPYNGNFIRVYHDLNGDGNYYNDGLRSYYLHFADEGILVDEGQIVAAGNALGYGGATGLAWTPHLHFEVQQRTELGWVAVDPFGWAGVGADPWHVPSHWLWDTSADP